jgi:hypothetical protein
MKYRVNDTWLEYEAEGHRAYGNNTTLLRHAVDLTANTAWNKKGFTIEKLFPSNEYAVFKREIYALLISLWKEAGLSISDDFLLDQYHTLIQHPDEHFAAVEKTKLISTTQFPLGIAILERRISQLCNINLIAKNPFDDQSVFHFRVIRPQSKDNNPLHRDVWLEDYESCINLYIPIAGSNALSSLILLPESHYWPESRIERTMSGAHINGIKFNVPAVTAIDGDFTIERPDPQENEMLLFSPYLIHGGAINLNTNKTRISIELRLWR